MSAGTWISPVNGLVLDWTEGRNPFLCGCREVFNFPEPVSCACVLPPPPPPEQCIDLITWAPWLSEVLIGIEAPNEDIAANYVRQAAIEFCRKSRALQRMTLKDWEPVVGLESFPGECVRGVQAVWMDKHASCSRNLNGVYSTQDKTFTFAPDCCTPHPHTPVLIWFWVSPNEDALRHDRFLYDEYRELIAERARAKYVRALHFRDRNLMAVVQTETEWLQGVNRVRTSFRQTVGGVPLSKRAGFL